MATPPPRKTSLSISPFTPVSSPASSPNKSQQPDAKRARGDTETMCISSFIRDANRGLDVWLSHGLIAADRKATLLQPFTDLDKEEIRLLDECKKWYANTYKAIAEKIFQLSKIQFAFPTRLSGKEFRERANQLAGAYISYLQSSLNECAEACRKGAALLWVPKDDFLLPVKAVSQAELSFSKVTLQANEKFKILHDFFQKRAALFRETRTFDNTKALDDLETVLNHLWHQESKNLFSLTIGYEALEWGFNICSALQRGDFKVKERKKELTDRVDRFTR